MYIIIAGIIGFLLGSYFDLFKGHHTKSFYIEELDEDTLRVSSFKYGQMVDVKIKCDEQ